MLLSCVCASQQGRQWRCASCSVVQKRQATGASRKQARLACPVAHLTRLPGGALNAVQRPPGMPHVSRPRRNLPAGKHSHGCTHGGAAAGNGASSVAAASMLKQPSQGEFSWLHGKTHCVGRQCPWMPAPPSAPQCRPGRSCGSAKQWVGQLLKPQHCESTLPLLEVAC